MYPEFIIYLCNFLVHVFVWILKSTKYLQVSKVVFFQYEEIETVQYEEYITDDQYEEVEEQVIGMQHLEEGKIYY